MRNFRLVTALTILLLSTGAQAAFISASDWHLTTDAYGGLKQSDVADNVYFAVAKADITWQPTDTYEMLSGFRWASSTEYESIMSAIPAPSGPYLHTYYNRGGWNGYSWEGKNRYTFAFSDTTGLNTKAKHAGNSDKSYWNYMQPGSNNFAGLVLIKDSVTVPEPSSLFLLVLGALGLGSRLKQRV